MHTGVFVAVIGSITCPGMPLQHVVLLAAWHVHTCSCYRNVAAATVQTAFSVSNAVCNAKQADLCACLDELCVLVHDQVGDLSEDVGKDGEGQHHADTGEQHLQCTHSHQSPTSRSINPHTPHAWDLKSFTGHAEHTEAIWAWHVYKA